MLAEARIGLTAANAKDASRLLPETARGSPATKGADNPHVSDAAHA